jgi:hypothetical protein
MLGFYKKHNLASKFLFDKEAQLEIFFETVCASTKLPPPPPSWLPPPCCRHYHLCCRTATAALPLPTK